MRGWAPQAERLIVLSESQIDRAERVLPVDPDRYVLIPNGYDPDLSPSLDHRALSAGLADEPAWADADAAATPASTSPTRP